jgi:hypothetical protein
MHLSVRIVMGTTRSSLGRTSLGTSTVDIESGYVESRFRDSRDPQGRLSYLSGSDRLKAISKMQVYDLESNTLIRIESLLE